MLLDNQDKEYYKSHPRVMEIRFAMLYDIVERDFGRIQATKFFELICKMYNCNFNILSTLMNKRFDIKRYSLTKLTRWRQEVIFVAALYDETLFKAAKCLGMSASNLYANKDRYDINEFLTPEWLKELDEETLLCNIDTYNLEIKRFFELVATIGIVIESWTKFGGTT